MHAAGASVLEAVRAKIKQQQPMGMMTGLKPHVSRCRNMMAGTG